MRILKIILFTTLTTLLTAQAFAANIKTDARGKTPAGNWVALAVDASGQLQLA